jgi:RNA recognition motif-containing protein
MSRLYVGNLSFETTKASLHAACAAGGRTVTDVNIVADRDTGRPRGFAFVDMSSAQEAAATITALHGSMLDGRQLTVSEAHARPTRDGGNGRHG